MKAVTFQALHTPLAFETLPDPTPDTGQVVIKVGRCGICGSDLHMTEDAAYGCQHGDVLGHEFAGEVVDLGREVEGLKTGDLVSVIPLKSCGHCEHCRKGEVQWCAQFGLQGGGYAEYAVTRPNQCVKLGADVSLADGAIIEPLAVALHGVNLSGMKAGDKVLVLGAGPIGLAVAFWARRMGAVEIPKAERSCSASIGPSHPPPRASVRSTTARPRLESTPASSGIRPAGRRFHSPYAAARASAMTADSGNG